MQDATAQMALLQFMQAGMEKTAVPSTVHCDHLIQAYEGASSDLAVANQTHKEVFDFLRSASQKFGIGFWGPGADCPLFHPMSRSKAVVANTCISRCFKLY